MDYHRNVKAWFKKALQRNPKIDPALRDKLIHGQHPQVKVFLDNLEREVKGAQEFILKKGRKPVDPKVIEGFIYDMTEVLCLGLQEKARRMYESDLARLERERKEQEVKDMEATLAGTPSGVYEEAGVLIDQKREIKEEAKNQTP